MLNATTSMADERIKMWTPNQSREFGGDDENENSALSRQLPDNWYVVVIGINKYESQPKLSCAVQDAEGIEKILVERFGFQLLYKLIDREATKDNIETLVKNKLRRELEENDALILFFAGHGAASKDVVGGVESWSGHLAPVGAKDNDLASMIDMKHFLDDIDKLPAKHILVILDACHSGMALGRATNSSKSPLPGYRGESTAETQYTRQKRKPITSIHPDAGKLSRQVITSARADQKALDQGGPRSGHSVFTGTLIDTLEKDKVDVSTYGYFTVSGIALYLNRYVSKFSSQQVPDHGPFGRHARGQLLLLSNEAREELRAFPQSNNTREQMPAAKSPAPLTISPPVNPPPFNGPRKAIWAIAAILATGFVVALFFYLDRSGPVPPQPIAPTPMNPPTPTEQPLPKNIPALLPIIANAGFEKGMAPWESWHPENQADADQIEKADENMGARGGSHVLKHLSNEKYEQRTFQSITVANGTYRATVWVRLRIEEPTNEQKVRLEVSDYGGKQLTDDANLNTRNGMYNWMELRIEDIKVTSGKIKIGVYSDLRGGSWARFDDFELTPQSSRN
jgi:Caspase domain